MTNTKLNWPSFFLPNLQKEGHLDKICHQVPEEVLYSCLISDKNSDDLPRIRYCWNINGGKWEVNMWITTIEASCEYKSACETCLEKCLQKFPTRIATQFLT